MNVLMFYWYLLQSQLPLGPKGVASVPISRWPITSHYWNLNHFSFSPCALAFQHGGWAHTGGGDFDLTTTTILVAHLIRQSNNIKCLNQKENICKHGRFLSHLFRWKRQQTLKMVSWEEPCRCSSYDNCEFVPWSLLDIEFNLLPFHQHTLSMQSLACGKARVLAKQPKGKDINDGDRFLNVISECGKKFMFNDQM